MMQKGIKTDLGSLNERQREAVLNDSNRILVLAGAGSGKTKTLLQKLIYLIEEKGVNPSNILAVTFTNNAANEMIDRLIVSADNSGAYEQLLNDKNTNEKLKTSERYRFKRKYKWINKLAVKTFHGFCYGMLRNHGVNEFDNKFKIIGDSERLRENNLFGNTAPETAFNVMHQIIVELCEEPNFLLALKKYVIDFFVDRIDTLDPKQQTNQYDNKFYTTLDGTRVRSKSEQSIADWMYRHQIQYKYEPTIEVKDFSFRPDFYVPEANLFIEHTSNKSFPVEGKIEQLNKGQLRWVITRDVITKDTKLFNKTFENIFKGLLPEGNLKPRSVNFHEEFKGYLPEVKDFVKLVMRVTDMVKVDDISIDDVLQRSRKDQHARVRGFFELAAPVFRRYAEYCVNKSYLDFNDLISRSISLLENEQDIFKLYRTRFQYILVDEFQDVNNLQVRLLKLLTGDTSQLFCVGDDWQSIYGFRGSNISYIIDFEKHFPGSQVVKLNLNYRSTQNIVGASNEVIKINKHQVPKEIFAAKKSEHKIVVFAGSSQEENIEFCLKRINELISVGHSREDIFFLYRRNKMFEPFSNALKNAGLQVSGKTIHACKGLEAKVVFIIGLTEGYGGFPDIWMNDRIFQTIKKQNLELLQEEERRLFYVAITRAKEKLFLITEKGSESSFINEIPEIFTVKTGDALNSVVDKMELCGKCFSQIQKLWVVCPYCGEKLKKVKKKSC